MYKLWTLLFIPIKTAFQFVLRIDITSWGILLHEPSFQYIHNLGVPSEWEFCDVFGTEPELLGMVPTPVLAVMLLYPINEKVRPK